MLRGNRGFGNDRFDGADFNPECDNNLWQGNRFRTVNQPCVADEGRGSTSARGRSGEAPGQQDGGPQTNRGRP